ncbi:MAG: type I-E CRISPR-associated protein Cse1/CasA [Pyrinomonadaceae bacterium MAG19_C2-C3]|nr:type I-E CRISPR-associated protein Cse1/CasA [Pyrinomonadaceae bacterium MAG19_C2-C3]
MTFTFDLTSQPWIPVLRNDGSFAELGLRDVLVQSAHLREVAHDSPLFVASIYPVLSAILHRVLLGRTTRERITAWETIWHKKQFGVEEVITIDAYFRRWSDRFDLFHTRFPFYQIAGLEMKESSALSRLAMEENNAPPQFANAANPEWQSPSPALAAQLLVTIQNFALGFGKSSKATIAGEEIEPPYSADGPLLRGFTVWSSGETLFQTLMLCLVPHMLSTEDKPCWELDAPHELRDKLVNGKRQTTPPRGVCDRLTLQSRLIRLLPEEKDGAVIVPRAYFTQGRSLEKDATGRPSFHPLKLYTVSKKEGVMVMGLSEGRAIWRNAHALLSPNAHNQTEDNLLAWMRQLVADGGVFAPDFRPNLNVVGMATEPGKAGKFLLWRHDRLPLPPALLLQPNLREWLEAANEDAERVAEEMRRRFKIVAITFIAGGTESGSKPHPDDVKAFIYKFDPRRSFWSHIENHFYRLLKQLPEQPELAFAEWERDVQHAAEECLQAACNSLGTSPRAISAVAQIDVKKGLQPAYLRDPKSYLAARKQREKNLNTASDDSEGHDATSTSSTPTAP